MEEKKRKSSEIEFHDTREEIRRTNPELHDEIYTNRRFYKTTDKSRQYVQDWFRKNCSDGLVLDYCCGLGQNSIEIASHGAFVEGIDISEESIKTARENAKDSGLEDNTQFQVMDAEQLEFKNDTFDVIVCSGVLHHLDLERAYQELARVLKPDGEIICIEALAHNPLLNWYRRRTPHLRSPWEIDHILSVKDINSARKYFEGIDIRYFHLASLAAIPLIDRPGFNKVLRFMNLVDDVILKIPFIQRLAWQSVFFLSEPKL